MFLTTNRIVDFDAAFVSRIHLAIKYPGLSPPSRRHLWETFITNDFQRLRPDWLSPERLDDLAARDLNGRRIKNIVRTAMALALAAGRELEKQDIYTSLKAMEDFEKEFADAVQESRPHELDRDVHDYGRHLPAAAGTGQKRRRFA